MHSLKHLLSLQVFEIPIESSIAYYQLGFRFKWGNNWKIHPYLKYRY